jgi:hypothetical protein
MVHNVRRLATTLLATLLLIGAGATAANAAVAAQDLANARDFLGQQATSNAQLQRQIDTQLRIAPGGKQTAANEVTYDGGKFVVTFAMPGQKKAFAVEDCPNGWFCFYDHTGYGYPRGKLSDCFWQDLGRYGWNDRTESSSNGTNADVEYINHYDMGNPANGHSYDQYLWDDMPAFAKGNVPYPNTADHVYRFC